MCVRTPGWLRVTQHSHLETFKPHKNKTKNRRKKNKKQKQSVVVVCIQKFKEWNKIETPKQIIHTHKKKKKKWIWGGGGGGGGRTLILIEQYKTFANFQWKCVFWATNRYHINTRWQDCSSIIMWTRPNIRKKESQCILLSFHLVETFLARMQVPMRFCACFALFNLNKRSF